MKLFSKISIKIFWAVLVSAIPEILKNKPLTTTQQEGLDLGKKIGDDVAKALTDSNPDDTAQLKEVFDEHKQEIAEVSLDMIEETVQAKVQDPTTKLVVNSAIATLRTVLQEDWLDNEAGAKALGIVEGTLQTSEPDKVETDS
jgi:hypothetical protein